MGSLLHKLFPVAQQKIAQPIIENFVIDKLMQALLYPNPVIANGCEWKLTNAFRLTEKIEIEKATDDIPPLIIRKHSHICNCSASVTQLWVKPAKENQGR